jgi:hypothetical protein
MSRFALLAAIAACATHPSTSLVGPVTCDGLTCPSGDLCLEQPNGGDAGVSVNCTGLDGPCDLGDCSGATCPTCVAELCPDYPALNDATLVGRVLSCPSE